MGIVTYEEAIGVPAISSAIDHAEQHGLFSKERGGIVAFKCFELVEVTDGDPFYKGPYYPCDPDWKIEPGAWIETEFIHMDRGTDCSYGIHAATMAWVYSDQSYREVSDHIKAVEIWEVFVPYEDMALAVFPYCDYGKFRVKRMQLVGRVAEAILWTDPKDEELVYIDSFRLIQKEE